MLSEKTAREMYSKNREKIIQHVRNNHGNFVVKFCKSGEVKIINTNSEIQDNKAEFSFKLHHNALIKHLILDAEFNKALLNYLPPSRI